MGKLKKLKKVVAILLAITTALSTLTFNSLETQAAESEWNFSYTGAVQEWVCPVTGAYKLEVWGASGGRTCLQTPNINGETILGSYGGEGGYSYGTVQLQAGDRLYICVGQEGVSRYRGIWGNENENGDWVVTHIESGDSFNGGGSSGQYGNGVHYMMGGGGGGATHIALNVNDGELKNYEDNQNDVLIVAGGGGGGAWHSSGTNATGGNGGGTTGGNARRVEGGQSDRGGRHVKHQDVSLVMDAYGNPIQRDGHTWQRYGSEVERINNCVNPHSWRVWDNDNEDWYKLPNDGCVGPDNTWIYGPGYERVTHLCGSFGKGGDSYNNNGSGGGGWYGGGGGSDGSADGGGGGSSHLNTALYGGGMMQGGNRGNGKAKVTALHVHTYTGTITTAPTCTTNGVRTYTCTCGDFYTEEIAALGHACPSDFSYADNNGITNGLAYKNCTRCSTRLDSKWLNRIRVRYQNADGSYGSYSNVVNGYYYSGNAISWSRAADAAYQYAGTSWTSTTVAKSVDITVYRKYYTLTLNKGTGISAVSGAGSKLYGSSVTIDATVKPGYSWVSWNGTWRITDKRYTFTMPAYDVTLEANGNPITYQIRYDRGLTNN